MAKKLDQNQMAILEKLVISNSFEIVGLVNVLEPKGLVFSGEAFDEIKRFRQQAVG